MINSRIFVFLIIFLNLAPLSRGVIPAWAIHDFRVEVSPRRIFARASYTLYFKLDKAMEVHDWIKVRFPSGTRLPELSSNSEKRREELKRIIESIYIGTSPCSACQGLPEINYVENSIRFNVHLGLDPKIEGYETIKITITDRVGIINPEKAGFYQLEISTAKETTPSKSEPYEIVTSRIGIPQGIPKVAVLPSKSNTKAGYTIDFQVGRGGALTLNQSRIRIAFPAGTQFELTPDYINPNLIQVNQHPVSVKLMLYENVLTFITPINIANEAAVSVDISPEAGFINPTKAGVYVLQVSTSEDIDWVSSDPYAIENSEPAFSVFPEYVSRPAEYRLSFLLETYELLSPSNPMEVHFPEGVILPSAIASTHVSINDQEVNKLELIGQKVLVYPSREIIPGALTIIRFLVHAGIENPQEAQSIRLSFRCAGSPALRLSSMVYIKELSLQWKDFSVLPPNAGASASYDFIFQLGSKGKLGPSDEIVFHFPQGSIYHESLNNHSPILLNEQAVEHFAWKDAMLKLTVPGILAEESLIHVHIPAEIGIHNPAQENQWVQFALLTTTETTTVLSSRLYITPSLPLTIIGVNGGIKGDKGWFVDPPILSFTCSQQEVMTYLWWEDHLDNALLYADSFRLDPGYYIRNLCFFSESAYGKESIQKVKFKVDTLAPSFSLIAPSSSYHLTQRNPFMISGNVHPSTLEIGKEQIQILDSPLLINNKEITLTNEGFFSIAVPLVEGENHFLVQYFDEAGNHTDKTFVLMLDSIAPKLSVLSPSSNQVVRENHVWVKGFTEPDVQLIIDGNIAYVASDGTFEHKYFLSHPGHHEFIVSATDPAGNSTDRFIQFWAGITLILHIGSAMAQVNHENSLMDVEPFIHSGRTMVPVRILGDALGAMLSYMIDEKTGKVIKVLYQLESIKIELYIGSQTAYVNGKQVALDVPAMIHRQRTMAPLRFVAENLQAQVTWDPSTERIAVVYWNGMP